MNKENISEVLRIGYSEESVDLQNMETKKYEDKGIIIQKIDYKCCEHPATLRGLIKEYERCIEIEPISICECCKIITVLGKFRVYDDGRAMQYNKTTGWVNLKNDSFLNRIINFFKNISKKLLNKLDFLIL